MVNPPSPDEPEKAQRGRPRGGRTRRSFPLRLPPELMDELRSWSNSEFRSLNGQIEFLLREAVRRRHSSDR